MSKKKAVLQGLTGLFAFTMAISVSASTIMEANKGEMDNMFHTSSTVLESTDGDGLYTTFTPNDKYVNKDANGKITSYNTKAFSKALIELGRKSGYEGSVLLKNENNVLPLAKGSGVTLLGKRSHTTLLGSGMGVDPVGQYVSLENALSGSTTKFAEENVASGKKDYTKMDNFAFSELNLPGKTDGAGAGYRLNTAMINKYTELLALKDYSCTVKDRAKNYKPNEIPASEISGVSLDGYKDAAIVVVGRPSAESGDFAKPAAGQRSILALTEEEQGIVKYATDNFEKVIVLVNTNSPMEIEELKGNDKVDAILWVGHPGNFGSLGIADILCGRVSPSGGLADTYAVDSMSSPAMMNFGDYTFANASDITRSKSNKYVIEAEGLYTGYKYYETRYYDSVLGQGNAASSAGTYASKGAWNYTEEVSYGFGYGLSYTTFDFAIEGTPATKQTMNEMYTTFNVRVTNTGKVSGSTPVQIYVQAPYIANGVEKSAIQLLEFGKSSVLNAGESEVVTVEVDWQNVASYDMNYANADGSKGSYILDAGEYYFAVGNGAHDALNNVLARQGKSTANGMDYNGKSNLVYVYNFKPAQGNVDGTTFGYSKASTKIKNQIPYGDWNYYAGGEKVTYLSRANWSGTYPKEYANLTAPQSMLDDLNGKYYETKTNQDTSDVKWGQSSELSFFHLAGMEYDDPRWQEIIDKMTLQDAITMAAYGGNTFAAAESVGFAGGKLTENTGNGIQTYTPANNLLDENCPWRVGADDKNSDMSLKVFGSAVLVASSFSHELLYEMGEMMGEQAILVGLPILWGPGGNTHRAPYNGRSGEYYSEDAVLTGVGCMEFAIGALEKGLIASPKHFAFNDQEDNRNGIAPFINEQRARETELRAFQIAFEATKYDKLMGKDVGMLGMMTSFSKIGAVECTSSVGLLKGIAVGEWNFHGYCVTDINDDFDLFDAVVMGGCTGYDNRVIGNPSWEVLTAANTRITNNKVPVTLEHYSGDRDLQLAIKESVHRTLYTFCQSVLMNQYNASTRIVEKMSSWRIVYTTAIATTSVLTGVSALLYVVATLKAKKEDV